MRFIAKNNEYNILQWYAVAVLIVTFLVAAPQTVSAEAPETVKFRVSSYIHKIMLSPVGDVKGHAIGFFSRRGLAFFEDGEVATYTNRGWLDLIKGSGTFEGYSTLDYSDKAQTVQKFSGVMKNTKGILLLEGTGKYVKGSGRFEGISGDFNFTCRSLTPYSRETKSGAELYCDAVAKRKFVSR